jgi:hypothetical protein
LPRRDVRRPPAGTDALVAHALASGDAYAAAGVYAVAGRGQRRLLERLMSERRATALRLAPMEGLSAAVIGALAGLEDEAVDRRLAGQPRLPGTALDRLIARGSLPVLVRLARNPALDVRRLGLIATSPTDHAVVRALCDNGALEGALIGRLAAGCDAHGLAKLAGQPLAPASVLRRAWQRGGSAGRLAVARHARCPSPLLRAAMRDAETAVRRAAAATASGDASAVLTRLAADPDWSVRRVAASNVALPVAALRWLAADPVAAVRRVVACRSELPGDLLKSLATDPDAWVRQGIARQPSAPVTVLGALAADAEPDVRRAVARHPRCPVALLRDLARDPQVWVRAAVAGHPRIPVAVRRQLLESQDVDVLSALALSPRTPQAALRRLARHPSSDVRRSVILNRSAGSRAVRPFVEDPYPLHRALAVAHPNLPLRDRWSMRLDPEPRIRLAVHSWFAGHLGGRALH